MLNVSDKCCHLPTHPLTQSRCSSLFPRLSLTRQKHFLPSPMFWRASQAAPLHLGSYCPRWKRKGLGCVLIPPLGSTASIYFTISISSTSTTITRNITCFTRVNVKPMSSFTFRTLRDQRSWTFGTSCITWITSSWSIMIVSINNTCLTFRDRRPSTFRTFRITGFTSLSNTISI